MTRYEIRVKGQPLLDWADWFCEMQTQFIVEDGQEDSDLLLTGDLTDQSALLGILMRLHNLNLTILSVSKIVERGINHVQKSAS